MLPIFHFKIWNGIGSFYFVRFISSISLQTLKWNRFEMHRDPQNERDMVFDSWFRSLWHDRSKIPIKTHVCLTDETTVRNSQKNAWLFFVRFEQPKIHRKARGRFSVETTEKRPTENSQKNTRSLFGRNDRETTDLKFAENRVVVFWSFHRWNFCTKRPAVVFWSFEGHLGQNDRSSGLLGRLPRVHIFCRKLKKSRTIWTSSRTAGHVLPKQDV